MKSISLLLLTGVLLVTTSCYQCVEKRDITKMTPVYMSMDELRSSVRYEKSRAIEKTGKIYFKDDFIYISEYGKGIHIINNQDPYAPTNIGFINVPGNSELAMKNNTLLANSAVDLVSINMSNPSAPVEQGRLENAFTYEAPRPVEQSIQYETPDLSKGCVVGWNEKVITEETECL